MAVQLPEPAQAMPQGPGTLVDPQLAARSTGSAPQAPLVLYLRGDPRNRLPSVTSTMSEPELNRFFEAWPYAAGSEPAIPGGTPRRLHPFFEAAQRVACKLVSLPCCESLCDGSSQARSATS